MGVSIDVRKAHASHHYGEIVQILTWVNDERAMVLIPAYRQNPPWYVVCESAAWKYNPDDETTFNTNGQPAAGKGYLIAQAKKAAEVLGMDGVHTWLKIAAIIAEGLQDLTRMPSAPMPEMLKASFGAMELREGGKTLVQQDIRLENEGAEYEAAPAEAEAAWAAPVALH